MTFIFGEHLYLGKQNMIPSVNDTEYVRDFKLLSNVDHFFTKSYSPAVITYKSERLCPEFCLIRYGNPSLERC